MDVFPTLLDFIVLTTSMALLILVFWRALIGQTTVPADKLPDHRASAREKSAEQRSEVPHPRQYVGRGPLPI
jgi:hypothetical protein